MTNPLRIHLERMLMAQDGVPLNAIQFGQWVDEARAALAAAPQPAPEQGMTRAEVGQMLDAKRQDRETLLEVIAQTVNDGIAISQRTASHIADHLLARGLRLPANETMAWAVLGEDGKMVAINYDRMTAQHLCNPAERVVRVAIRVVEGGDDAA